ncbi:MAG: hypothetical protein AAGI44_01395 [Pseudomonadota bacterium]
MTYSVMNVGNSHRLQAQAIFDQLAREETQREITNDQLEASQDAADKQTVGTLAGIGLGEDLRRWRTGGEAINTGVSDPTVGVGGSEILPSGSAGDALGMTGGDASGVVGDAILEPGAVKDAITMAGDDVVGTAGQAIIQPGSVASSAVAPASTATAAAGTGTAAAGTAATGAAATGSATAGGAAAGAKAGTLAGPWGMAIGAAFGLLANSLF